MNTINQKTLHGIISNGYNMQVVKWNETHVTISVGGSEATFAIKRDWQSLGTLLNDFRRGLGCTSMNEIDTDEVDAWQAANQPAIIETETPDY